VLAEPTLLLPVLARVEVFPIMRHLHDKLGLFLALALLASGSFAADEIKSGPQPGQPLGPPFNPLSCNGPHAGQRVDLVEKNGANPVALIFAREITSPLLELVKKLDEAAAQNRDARLGSLVVFCSDDEGLEKKLQDLARKEGLKHVILTLDASAGPRGYQVARDADVTVILYNRKTVKVNHAFKKGELTPADVDKIIRELKEVLPPK
jgi:hypothetical protein